MEYQSITALLAGLSASRLGDLFAHDPQQAAEWIYVLAAEGLPAAQVCYGRMLLEGTGITKDPEKALLWFRRAATGGDLDAINMVGRCLDNGWGSREDPSAAAVHFSRAADGGHSWAQYNLGHLYLDGRGVPRDRTRAFQYYLRAAEQQHERAMNLVGRCFEEGWGTPCDALAAAAWYQRSAHAGYFRGHYNWGSMLLKSGRVGEAALWFERAAVEGTPGVRQAVMDLLRAVLSASAAGAAVNPLRSLEHRLRVLGPVESDAAGTQRRATTTEA